LGATGAITLLNPDNMRLCLGSACLPHLLEGIALTVALMSAFLGQANHFSLKHSDEE
jgi:hypothetical protein